MSTLASSFSILTQPGVFLYLLRGVAFTCILSVLGVILGLILGSLPVLARTYCKRARLAFWGGSRRPISSFSATRPICSGSLCAWCSVPARHSLPRQRPHKTEVLLYLPFPSYSKPFAQKARARAAETAAGCGLSAPVPGAFLCPGGSVF